MITAAFPFQIMYSDQSIKTSCPGKQTYGTTILFWYESPGPAMLDDWYRTRHHGFESPVGRLNRWTLGLHMDFSARAAPYTSTRKLYICRCMISAGCP